MRARGYYDSADVLNALAMVKYNKKPSLVGTVIVVVVRARGVLASRLPDSRDDLICSERRLPRHFCAIEY